MPDMRYSRSESSLCYSQAKDYPEVNRAAIAEMHRQAGDLVLDDDAIAVTGLLIRHLVLPNGISGSKAIFEFLAEKISKDSYISLMSQYFPANRAPSINEISRRLKNSEFKEAVDAFHEAGLHNGYIQPYPQSFAL
jgi:putative pyruvate formate lyase activating enzyme